MEAENKLPKYRKDNGEEIVYCPKCLCVLDSKYKYRYCPTVHLRLETGMEGLRKMVTESRVLMFISKFTKNGERKEVIETFTQGCCYWFAKILSNRFNGFIMYDHIEGHFGTRIGKHVYDITGDVTEGHTWEEWEGFDAWEWGSEVREMVYRNCVYLEDE